MRTFHSAYPILLTLLILMGASRAEAAGVGPASEPAAESEPFLGGAGGVYLLATPGQLTIDVSKRDLNRRGSNAVLRALLVGPDRRVIQEATIPDDGQPRGSGRGPLQQIRLSADVPRAGIYAVNITVAQDRYGEEAVWGFATNCPRYLIETSRGHRDQAHQEPIVLAGPAQPVDVCFLPPARPFGIEITGLPSGTTAVSVYNSEDRLVQMLNVQQGRTEGTFADHDATAQGPWRLQLPVRQATIQIDGVTRWDSGDTYPDLSYWTTERSAWFPWLEYRWLLTPYSRLVYAPAGGSGELALRLHNNADQPRTIRLAIEFPGAAWPVELDSEQIRLRGKQSIAVKVRYTAAADGQPRVCHLRATPQEHPEFTTYSTLEVRSGGAPAAQPLQLPLVLKPYQHENEQFGYLPDYPLDNQPYFDRENQPCFATSGGIATWRDGSWAETELDAELPAAASAAGSSSAAGQTSGTAPADSPTWRLASTKLAFDRDNVLYAVARADRAAAVLYSNDQGRTFSACRLPGEGRSASFDLADFTGHNPPDEPPAVVRYTLTASDPKLFWRRLHNLELFVPTKTAGQLDAGQPILISRKCIGLASHSGIPSTVTGRAGQVHVVWAEATEPEEKVPGVPTYVATYDRQSGQLSEPALIGYGAPPNDIHNTPSITLDSRGYLHVLAGTHGRPFQYARSLQPNTAAGGWTEAVATGSDLPQTYIGMVCGPDDTLHLTYRLWRSGQPPHPASQHATLAYQQKKRDEPWGPPQILIVPPFSEYSVYYHRLTLDRRGALYLSYDHWSTFWFYRTDHPGRRRALLTSPDGGQSWKLAETADLLAR